MDRFGSKHVVGVNVDVGVAVNADLLGKQEQNRATFEGTGGNSQEYYDIHWWRGFDMVFLVAMSVWLAVLIALSATFNPAMFTKPADYWSFWVEGVGKLLLESSIGFLGGLLVIYRNVKVNYVRKIQHFCAYLIPLLFATFMPKISRDPNMPALTLLALSTLDTWWGYWFMMNAFFLLIFPLRSRVWPLFVIFSSMDRPEDRPHTLKWISTQVFLGYCIMSVFTFITAWQKDASQNLLYIAVFTTGIGDGLAEPVGIAWGRHKYKARALCSSRSYTRSLEGSACVFIVAAISCAAMYNSWPGWFQFMIGILTIPVIMTFVEAFSPHTWDTPFLFASSVLLIYGAVHVPTPSPENALMEGLAVGLGGGALVVAIVVFAIWWVVSHPLRLKKKPSDSVLLNED